MDETQALPLEHYVPTPSVLKQTLFNLLSSRLLLNLPHTHSHTHYSPLPVFLFRTHRNVICLCSHLQHQKFPPALLCVLANKVSHFCFPLQWLDNCRKTFGDKDSNQRPNTQAQVEKKHTHLTACFCLSTQM